MDDKLIELYNELRNLFLKLEKVASDLDNSLASNNLNRASMVRVEMRDVLDRMNVITAEMKQTIK